MISLRQVFAFVKARSKMHMAKTFFRARHLSYRRGKRNTNPNTRYAKPGERTISASFLTFRDNQASSRSKALMAPKPPGMNTLAQSGSKLELSLTVVSFKILPRQTLRIRSPSEQGGPRYKAKGHLGEDRQRPWYVARIICDSCRTAMSCRKSNHLCRHSQAILDASVPNSSTICHHGLSVPAFA